MKTQRSLLLVLFVSVASCLLPKGETSKIDTFQSQPPQTASSGADLPELTSRLDPIGSPTDACETYSATTMLSPSANTL
jgi:hypothetical protein